MIRVLVVDDSATAREAITMMLRSTPDIEVIGEASDGAEGVALPAAESVLQIPLRNWHSEGGNTLQHGLLNGLKARA